MQSSSFHVAARLIRACCLLAPLVVADLSAQSLSWARLQPSVSPPGLWAFRVATDAARQRVVLFGGAIEAIAHAAATADTWLWDGHDWQLASPGAQPPARLRHAMAYDPARQRVVLFGGRATDSGYLADTWEWDGQTWAQMPSSPSSPSPSAREYHAMAYDQTTQSVLLFGGAGAAGPLADTWLWNGFLWTQAVSATAPLARRRHAMATDPVRQRVVLFGGSHASLGTLADTWEWNGSSWLPALGVVGVPGPAPRYSSAIAFDSTRGETFLFGGFGSSGASLGDSWSFDGNHWTSRPAPAVSPSPRGGAALCADPQQVGLVLFGGYDGAYLRDTWRNFDRRALPYGTGCGAPPVRLLPDDTGLPILGRTGSATILDAPTPAAIVVVGLSDVFYGPFPLPLTLAGIGMPGCNLLQSADIFGLATTPLGPTSASFAVTIPDQASLLGEHFFLQAVVFAPGYNEGQIVVSNAIDWTVDDGLVQIEETFGTAANQDLDGSSSVWNNGARPGRIGGDGRHGAFDVTLGTPLGGGVYEWNTDSFTIPAQHSLTGQEYLVTDGRFYFSNFVLPAGATLRFTGTVPPQIWVRGSAAVHGIVDISAADMPYWMPTTGPAAGQRVSDFNGIGPSTTYSTTVPNFADGQPGGAGGAGGGRGGDGARECRLDGDVTQTIGFEVVHLYYGRNGQDVRVPAGHAYAGLAAGTGGKGSLLQPIAGTAAAASTPLLGFIYRGNFTPGGGGGGFAGPGTAASITAPPAGVAVAAIQPAGITLPSLVPPVVLGDSLNHFLVGGSGGGGGGSHAYGTLNVASIGSYVAGAGGTGGGGALALRAGGDLTVAATAQLHARGGDGVLITGDDPNTTSPDASWGVTSPGGGGSGGSFLLQGGRSLTFAGLMNVRGGQGSRTGSISISAAGVPAAFDIGSQAGSGAPGFYRLESGAGLPSFTGSVVAGTPAYVAGNFGNGTILDDRDSVTGSLSAWRTSGATLPPTWVRYELDVDLDGNGTVDVTYTDSGAPGTQPANDLILGVRIGFQGARLDASGVPIPGTIGPWRDGVGTAIGPGLDLDAATGFRFLLHFDTAVAGSAIVVRALRVFANVGSS